MQIPLIFAQAQKVNCEIFNPPFPLRLYTYSYQSVGIGSGGQILELGNSGSLPFYGCLYWTLWQNFSASAQEHFRVGNLDQTEVLRPLWDLFYERLIYNLFSSFHPTGPIHGTVQEWLTAVAVPCTTNYFLKLDRVFCQIPYDIILE